MCQIDGVSTGKLHDFRPGGGAGQRPGGWVEGIGWVALGGTLVSGDEYRIGVTQPLAMRRDEPMSPDWTDVPVVVVRWADGTEPDEEDEQHALAAPPSTPAEQPQPDDAMSGTGIARALHAGRWVQQWSSGETGCDNEPHWCDLGDPEFWLDHIGDRMVVARIAPSSGTGEPTDGGGS